MPEETFNITKSTLVTIAIAVAVIAVVIVGIAMVTSQPTGPNTTTGLVTAQSNQASGSQASGALAGLPNMVGGC